MSKFHKRHPKAGSMPGTLVIHKDATPPKVRVMEYNEGNLDERDITDVEELAACLDRQTIAWVDVQGLGDEAVLRRIADIFSVHALALEDVVNVPQRPKVEPHDDHLLFITRMLRVKHATHLNVEQISVFLGKNYVLTFQERYGDVLDPVRQRLRAGKGVIRKHGADYLAYAIIDAVIDAYYPVLETLGDFLEDLEDEVVLSPTTRTLRQIYAARRELLTLRRSIWPQREAINSMLRDESGFVSDDVRVYLRDTYDHCVQLIDATETYRELAGGLMDAYLSSVGNRQNEVMKTLTIMASIFIPLTFLAGIYGMNFDFMPETKTHWGYPILLLLMAAITVGMVVYFRRLGWIGGDGVARDRDQDDEVERS